MSEESDDALIRRCASDHDAFRELLRRHEARVYGFLAGLVGRTHADDLFQEVWMKVLRAAPRYEPRGRASSWLVKIAHNAARDHFAALRRAPAPLDEATPDGAAGPERALEAAELEARFRAAVAALPPEQRQVVLLRELGELSFEEIAAEQGVPLGTALSRMHAASAKLRRALGEDHVPA